MLDAFKSQLSSFREKNGPIGKLNFSFFIIYILKHYTVTRPGNFITRLLPGRLLPGPGIVKPTVYSFNITAAFSPNLTKMMASLKYDEEKD